MIDTKLKAFVERIERLEEEKKGISTDIGEVYGEAEEAGYDKKALKLVIKDRRLDSDDYHRLEERKDEYHRSIGSFADTPLGRAAAGLEIEVR
jgi:uncharacterized protein (UPF0335 family)